MGNKKKGVDIACSAWSMSDIRLFEQLQSSGDGLASAEAVERQRVYGRNEIERKDRRHGLMIFFYQFKNPLVLILIFAAIIAYFLGTRIDAIVILFIVLLTSVLSFCQEYRAERVLSALSKYVTLTSKALRDGKLVEIDDRELVPGDIVYLNIGDIIPADIRILKEEGMTTDESSLTGESAPVIKNAGLVSKKNPPAQELSNMALMGTTVVSGSGHGIVIAAGKNTFFGKAASFVNDKNPETDFQKSIREFGNFLLKIIVTMSVFIFIANAILGKGILSSFLFAMALAVGITPEVLPILMTIALSTGALRMAKNKVIIKKLASVEDLGNIDTLCCDKTGTLTEGKLALYDYLNLDGRKDDKLVLYAMLCGSEIAELGEESKNVSDDKPFNNPVDRAVWQSRKAKQLEPQIKKYAFISDNEFDFERRRQSVLVKRGKERILIVKGAPESILSVCKSAKLNGKKKASSKKLISKIREKIEKHEGEGLKVIAIAEKNSRKSKTTKQDEKELCLIGFLLFFDPPKKGVKESLEMLQKLGVRIKILSGDNPLVTRKICMDVGLEIAHDAIVTGDQIEELNDLEFEGYVNEFNVFARVTPEQKYKIVKSLNREGHIVGFLGDGINDVAALKAADVGISVDSGTNIAKETADIILLKKSLNVLVQGIIEGRKTFGNIMKYILNTISANYGNMFTVAVSSLFLKFIPLLPSQILLNNFLSDIPLLTLSTDNVDEEFLKKPKRWNMNLISKFMIYFGLISSFFDLALITALIFLVKAQPELFRTSWFVLSALTEITVTFAIRTRLSFLKSQPSKWLMTASVFAGAAAIIVTYTTFGSNFFQFSKMSINILMMIAGIVLAYFVTAEIAKRYFFKMFEI